MFWEYNYQMPEVSRASENGAIEKTSVSFNLPKGYEWREELPSVGAYCEGLGYYSGYQLIESPGYDIIRLNFTAQPSSDLPGRDSRKVGDDVWTFHLFNYERDLRLKADYKTYWTYNLASGPEATAGDISTAVSGWGLTATDITLDAAKKPKFRWVADTGEIPDGWAVCLKRLYTFDTYKRMTATATRILYYKDYSSASAGVVYPPCTLAAPGIAIPCCSMDSTKWMIEDRTVSGDGDLFTAVTNFSYNPDGWTTAIYA